MKHRVKIRMVMTLLGVLAIVAALPITAIGEVPHQINYQGYITDDLGNPLDGEYWFLFSIYDVPTGGTALWQENPHIRVTNGVYNVHLGLNPTGNPFPDDLFDGQCWLGVAVESDPEMVPRQLLTSTPFAKRAAVADRVEDGVIETIHLANDAVTGDKIDSGAVSSSHLQDGTAISEILDDDGAGSGLDADTVDGKQASSFLNPGSDYGRSGVTSNLYEGTTTLTNKYVNQSGDDMTGRLTAQKIYFGTGWQETIKGSLLGGDAVGAGVYGYTEGSGAHGVHGGAIGTDGVGVYGEATGIVGRGVSGYATNTGYGTNYGGYFEARGDAGNGVYGEASGSNGNGVIGYASNTGDGGNSGGRFISAGTYGLGVLGHASGTYGKGVHGYASSLGDGTNYGGYFEARGAKGRGVYGKATSTGDGTNYGGYFLAQGINGRGVYGYATGKGGHGVYGIATNLENTISYGGYFEARGPYGRGVVGFAPNTGATTVNYGGLFEARSKFGSGVYGIATGSEGAGVYGSGGKWAGYFNGDVRVAGTLTKGGGGFKIDHPLDPDNRYLNHSFVESPDMMNIYNGNVVLDDLGEALVELPDWFEALNRDFRYQLTAIGAPGPNLYIAEEISDNTFRIAGGEVGMKVSWQVTGIRQDPWANANHIPVEEDKTDKELGYYLHPELYGQPEEKGIEWARDPEMMKRMKEEREKPQAPTS